MLLTIDIGNTNIVAGVFVGNKLAAHWRVATDARRTADEHGVLLESLFRLARLDMKEIDGVAMCSVVPDVLASLCETIRRYFHQEPLVVTLHLDLGIEILYSPRTGVGADRLANAVAAIHLYGAPAVVVDFGTGTNFDVVSEDRAYIGGAIAPGLEIAEEALYAHAAQLTRVPLEPPPAAIGNNTTAAVQSGLLYGYAGLVDGLVARFCQELGRPAHVIATGGLAEIVAPYARSVQHVDPDLTLVGLQLIYSRNAPYAGSARTRQG